MHARSMKQDWSEGSYEGRECNGADVLRSLIGLGEGFVRCIAVQRLGEPLNPGYNEQANQGPRIR